MDEKPQDGRGEDVTEVTYDQFKAGSVIKKKLQPYIQLAAEIAAREKKSQRVIEEGQIPSTDKSEKTVQEPLTRFSERRKTGFEPDVSQEPPVVIRPCLQRSPKGRKKPHIITIDDSDDERASPTVPVPIGYGGRSDRQPVEVVTSEVQAGGSNYYTAIESAAFPSIPPSSYRRNAGSGWRGMGGNRRGRAGRWASSFNASRDETVTESAPQDHRNEENRDEDYPGSRRMRGRLY